MQTTERPALAALFRMMEARLRLPAVGLYAWRSDACRWLAGSESRTRSASDRPVDWQPLPPGLARALALGKTFRFDPAELGLAGAFGAVQVHQLASAGHGFAVDQHRAVQHHQRQGVAGLGFQLGAGTGVQAHIPHVDGGERAGRAT